MRRQESIFDRIRTPASEIAFYCMARKMVQFKDADLRKFEEARTALLGVIFEIYNEEKRKTWIAKMNVRLTDHNNVRTDGYRFQFLDFSLDKATADPTENEDWAERQIWCIQLISACNFLERSIMAEARAKFNEHAKPLLELLR